MIGLESLRWLLTVAFGGAALFHLHRILRPARAFPAPTGEHLLSEALHLVMGISMIAMIWPWGGHVPVAIWLVVFALSTGWFMARALWSAGHRLVLGYFATMMAA